MARVAFTGSFDPPHVGHIYVIDRAIALGHEVIVIVANNVEKKYNSSLSDRLDMAQVSFKKAYDVVSSDSENIGELIRSKGCNCIIRGVRNAVDFEYEQTVADWNLEHNFLHTIYIPCPPFLRNVSSTKIREG